MGDRTPTIVGIGLSDYPKTPHLDALAHHGLAIRRALDDSGVQKSDIDGLLCFGSYGIDDAVTMAEVLGITLQLPRRHLRRGHGVRVLRPARRGGDRARRLRHGPHHLRLGPPLQTGSEPGDAAVHVGEPPGRPAPVRDALRQPPRQRLRPGRPPPHAPVRHHIRAAGEGGGRHPRQRGPESRSPCTATP